MNKRSFLKSILLCGIAPSLLISTLPDKMHWKKTDSGLYVVNPDWVNAPFEISFLFPVPIGRGLPADSTFCNLYSNLKFPTVSQLMEKDGFIL